ncbi:hypothetical protein BJY04DRAFT_210203 [Aspergillus karnatakaensis]|uniref:C2H2-type zinc finger protein n=1 Tax=Aspergillus karnatakaensis TaxID=1810916 RepID=UPI003CCE2E3D
MYECEFCPETFYHREDYEDHMNDDGHWPECEVCTRTFYTQRACDQHMDAVGHWTPRYGCQTCSKAFYTQHAANQHMTDVGHWAPTVPCETCDAMFFSQTSANQHMEALGHYKNYCKSCDRFFQNENNLRMHLTSKIHRGRQMLCPFCKAAYTSASGLVHHLERGSCPKAPNMNREAIHRMIQERDPNGLITNKQIGWKDEDNISFSANHRAWNGSGYECYLCHRVFTQLNNLNQHLQSPKHKQAIYHCPNWDCPKSFTALAALFNHLESESCAFMRFEKVQKSLGDVIGGRRTISFA